MPSIKLEQRLDQYKAIYSELKNELKWKFADQRTLMIISSMYTTGRRSFDMPRFLDISDNIKQAAGVFSPLRSGNRYTFAAMFDLRFEEPKQHIKPFLALYEKMVKHGFKKNIFTYLSALILLSKQPGEDEAHAKIGKSLAIHKGMKDKHAFLTSAADYPLAVLLAESALETDKLIDGIETFYERLAQAGFRKGNDLQFLSHILSLLPDQDPDLFIMRSIRIFEEFTKQYKKPKPPHYPEIGMLALLENGAMEIGAIMEAAQGLNSDKMFRWHKDMNLKTAVNLFISEKTDDPALLEGGLYHALEAVIQAQQTAAIAVITSTAAASQTSGS
ncbi:DUF4003 domain-containing protein [Bacillus swezeyi]|uniref:DUF4003 domain-containing protein n=1 Tax=Bacillus swezeyi TaxID=1925020 RepID=UPI002E2058F4|nr:DUF4003 domain-containing protein [Bacillus swezeyi]MED2976226.1 DUF4003 domain-containing protein [Bacillus swezeyi]